MPYGEIHRRIEGITREEHNELIFYINRFTKSTYIAEDMLQEAYLEALKRAEQIRDPDKLIPWLKTVGKRLAINEMRKQSRLIKKSFSIHTESTLLWDEELINRLMISDLLTKVLKGSPSYYRSVIRLRYQDKMSYQQIGEKLGISSATARQINTRVLKKTSENSIKK